jgi:hypothetical protein
MLEQLINGNGLFAKILSSIDPSDIAVTALTVT